MRGLKRLFYLLAILLIPVIVLSCLEVQATSVSEGYKTNDNELVVGMAASLSPESTTENRIIERAASSNGDRFAGVVTTSDAQLLTLADQDSTIYVATLGDVTVYASDVNGQINKGDFVALSPLKGLIMRADAESEFVLGTALADFSTDDAQTQEVDSSDGKRTVLINEMRIELTPRNVARQSQQNAFLLVFGRSLTGKAVSQLQVLSALVIFFFLIIIEGSIAYGAIYSSITALGRNPLARASVYRHMIQVVVVAISILIFGLGAIYTVLWS